MVEGGGELADLYARYSQYGIGFQIMLKMGFQPGGGLGPQQRGVIEPIALVQPSKGKLKRMGLGTIREVADSQLEITDQKELGIDHERLALHSAIDLLEQSKPFTDLTEVYRFSKYKFWTDLNLDEFMINYFRLNYQLMSQNELDLLYMIVPLELWTEMVGGKVLNEICMHLVNNSDFELTFQNLVVKNRYYYPFIGSILDYLVSADKMPDVLNSELVLNFFMEFDSEVKKIHDFCLHNLDLLGGVELRLIRLFLNTPLALRLFEGMSLEFMWGVLGKLGDLEMGDSYNLVKSVVLPKWSSELKTQLVKRTLTQTWWNHWEQRLFPILKSLNLDLAILNQLNLINQYLDTNKWVDPELELEITTKMVLEHYVSKYSLNLEFNNDHFVLKKDERTVYGLIRDELVYIYETKWVPVVLPDYIEAFAS